MNLAETLEIPAEIMPGAPVVAMGGDAWTFESLLDRAGKAAAWLRSQDVGPGTVIATVQGFSLEFTALLYGAVATGAIVAPLNVRAKAPELGALLEHLRPALLVGDERYDSVLDAAFEAGSVDAIRTTTSQLAEILEGPLQAALCPVEPGDGATAILLHTSGTTGRPKPVNLTHDALTATLLRTTPPADGTPRGATLLGAPNHHIAGLSVLMASVFSGRRADLLPSFTALGWLEAAERNGVDHAFLVPTMLRRILDEPAFAATDLSALRTLAYGAAPMPRPVILEALERFPARCSFVASYGQTETGGTICVLSPDDHAHARDGDAAALQRLGSIGRPLVGVEVAILDEAGTALGPQARGEIAVRFAEGVDHWHRTGDLGFRDGEGYVFLSSRRDDLIIRGGENIDPMEVERVLAAHPEVRDVAVAGVPDVEWGQVVVAFVVRRGDEAPGQAELIQHAKRALASFKAPTRVHYVDELPRTDLGKLRRRELVDRLITTAKGRP